MVNKRPRENGYYWVLYKKRWYIGNYNYDKDYHFNEWQLFGFDEYFDEKELSKISHKITRNP